MARKYERRFGLPAEEHKSAQMRAASMEATYVLDIMREIQRSKKRGMTPTSCKRLLYLYGNAMIGRGARSAHAMSRGKKGTPRADSNVLQSIFAACKID